MEFDFIFRVEENMVSSNIYYFEFVKPWHIQKILVSTATGK